MIAGGKMRYALVDGIRRLPEKGLWGTCPLCGQTTISKCGSQVVHHWAHKSGEDCDSWSEPIGPWHLEWQGCVAPDSVEVVIGEHRADIIGKNRRVVELQHSSISVEEIAAREDFYGDMIWLFDATERFELIPVGRRGFFTFRRTRHILACRKPVFLDFGDVVVEVEAFTSAIPMIHGFGLLISRESFAEQQFDLSGKPPRSLDSRGYIRWLKDHRYDRTEHASKWIDPQSRSEITIPKGAVHMRLTWGWKKTGGPFIHEWERIIEDHGQVANGWTKRDLQVMQQFLNAKVILLDGTMRLMPSPAASISVTNTVAATKQLLLEVESHIAAGRLPILKDATKEYLLQAAAKYEKSQGGGTALRKSTDPQRSIFD